MIVLGMWGRERGQIALEFIIVYSIVLVIFVLVFTVISGQRATILNAQQGSIARIEAQEIAGYIDHAISAGSGYSTTLTLAQGPGAIPYNIYISTSGVVIVNSSSGGQPVSAYAFSDGRGMNINGSLQYKGNGIGLYLIPAYTGTIKVSNIAGTVYIDRGSVSNAGMLGSSILTNVQEGYAPIFNGQTSYIQIPNVNQLQLSTLTISSWVDYAGVASGGTWNWLLAKQNAWGVAACGVSLNPCYFDWHAAVQHTSTTALSKNTWYFMTAVISGGTETIYVNGANVLSGALTVQNQATTGLQIGYGNSGGQYLNGTAANIQIYNASLSPQTINALYQEGVMGSPVQTANLVAWWPLDGNSNDYSGNGNNGQYSNIFFKSMASLTDDLIAKNGSMLNGVPIGVVLNNATTNSVTAIQGTSTNGIYSGIVTYNTVNPNATVYTFNGNLSLTSNIVAWLPLTQGASSGNSVYSVSGSSSNGMAVGIGQLAITLTNTNSTTGTGSNFQQMIWFNPANSLLSPNEASDLGNIRFYQGPTELYSWCESGCNTISSTNAIFWVKVPSGVTAGNSVTINMTFLSTSADYDSVYAGEAPQITCPTGNTITCTGGTYAKYDNGPNVFSFYDNFAGSSLSSKWVSALAANSFVANEVYLGTWGGDYYTSSKPASASPGNIIEIYGHAGTSAPCGNVQQIVSIMSQGVQFTQYGTAIVDNCHPASVGGSISYNWAGVQIPSYVSIGTTAIFSVYVVNTLSSSIFFNYGASQSATLPAGDTLTFPAWIGSYNQGDDPMYFNWVRSRIAPPGGLMPSFTTSWVASQSSGGSGSTANSLIQWKTLSPVTNFAAASFPGNAVQTSLANYGVITTNALGSANAISSLGNMTVVAWVKYNGGAAAGCYGIFGSGGITGSGVQLNAKTSGNQCGIVYIGGVNAIGNYIAPLSNLNWTMISMAWNGKSSIVSVYENGSATYSNVIVGSSGISPTGSQYYIGAQNSIGGGAFNGLISNVQLYSRTLGAAQIGQLYAQGPTGVPLLGTGLVGWWPLTGSAIDYIGGNNGTRVYNAIFAMANYSSSASAPLPARIATFNGNSIITLSGGGIPFNGPFSTSVWFSSAYGPSKSFDSEILDGQLPYGNAYDVQLCGGGYCGFTGIHGSIGTGTASLSSSVNYAFQFAALRRYNLVETFSTSGWVMYLNGANVSSGSYSGTPAITDKPSGYLQIGGGTVPSSNFNGQIYDVQIYNAVLTAAQAAQIYQQGPTPQISVTLSGG